MHSIRVKISAITIAAILISILSVIGAGFFTIKGENDRSTADRMNLLCESTQKSLDSYFKSIEQSVEMAAGVVRDTLDATVLVECGVTGTGSSERAQSPEKKKELDSYLSEYFLKVQDIFSSEARHTQGVVSYYFCISPQISDSVHGFFYSKMGRSGFARKDPINAGLLDPEDTEHSTWYFTPIHRGRPSWVGPFKDSFFNDEWIVSYLAPIYKAGTLIGVLGMDIPFETLVSQIQPIRVYKTGFAFLLDENGMVLYHPLLPYGTTGENTGLSSLDWAIFKEENSGDELIRYEYNGQNRQMSFCTLSTGMKLVVSAPVSEITASWGRLTRIILWSTAIIIAFFIIFIVFFLKLLIRPLQLLTSASQKLAAGDYDVELAYHGKDEVGTLTKAFSQMRDHMKLYISDLNRRIYTDDMTGLPNMKYYFQLAESRSVKIREEGRYPVILFFNLLGMKYYNRQYGFSRGDQLIRSIADILSAHYGNENCCRFGQDHFTVLTDEENLEKKIREIIHECEGINGGRTLPLQVGIYPERIDAVEVSVACDRAKYACDQYRGSYVSGFYYFDERMLKQFENYSYVVNNLDRAIQEQWIKVYYQPIVRASNGKVCDEEALSRWMDPEKGFLSPGDFIPILEKAGLITRLDLYVLDQILQKIQRQKKAGLYIVPQSLNLSRVDFDHCDIVDEICKRVDAAGIPRENLTIEITESMVGSDFDFMKDQVERFQRNGFQVWMDDFGSGYSSLDVLQDIHFDLIKFDMRFMQRFEEGTESRIILTELMKMAIALGIETVVEGVETKEQAEFLREIGCTKLQGYYFCKAIPLEEIIERNKKGIQIGFENPDETAYYTAIGRINLYDMMSMANVSEDHQVPFFDTLPMAIIESDEETVQIVRCNKSCRELIVHAFGGIKIGREETFTSVETAYGVPLANALRKCVKEKEQVFLDETLPNGAGIFSLLQYIAANPVTGRDCCVLVIFRITEGRSPIAGK